MTKSSRQPGEPTESELKLVVWERDPEAMAKRISSLQKLDSYRLQPPDRIALKDTYFDTPHRDLSRGGNALRTREQDGRQLVTLKGPSETRQGVSRKFELEAEWSEEAFEALRRELANLGLPVRLNEGRSADPRSTIERMGFVLLSQRETDRLQRAVIRGVRTDQVVAKLAIDRVSDKVDPLTVRHFEIEVEAVDDTTISDVAKLGSELKRIGGMGLRPFGHSKLAISLSIHHLASRNSMEGLVDDRGYLTPDGWSAIDRLLQSSELVGRLSRVE
jgi:inorganic triphosphatase YgiF